MKKLLISIYRKLTLKMITIITLVAVNVYLLTYPSKVLGKIIDLLSNIEKNKPLIINHIVKLLLVSILIVIVRIVWKYLLAITTRQVEKGLKDNLFDHFLKIKLSSIQNIKNGELMSYFVKDIGEIRGITYRLLSHATRVIFILIITSITMAKVNLSLTIAAICPILITTYIIMILKKYVLRNLKNISHHFLNMYKKAQMQLEPQKHIRGRQIN